MLILQDVNTCLLYGGWFRTGRSSAISQMKIFHETQKYIFHTKIKKRESLMLHVSGMDETCHLLNMLSRSLSLSLFASILLTPYLCLVIYRLIIFIYTDDYL
jgi:hypothetical protein